MISTAYEFKTRVGGNPINVELEPACWLRGNCLGILVRGEGVGGAAYRSKVLFDSATESDLKMLLKQIKLAPCSLAGCKRRFLIGEDTASYNPEMLCEPHRLEAIYARAAVEQTKVDAEKALADSKAKARGYRYKATIWIHRNDRSDTYLLRYYRKKPPITALQRLAKRHGSKLVNDFSVIKL